MQKLLLSGFEHESRVAFNATSFTIGRKLKSCYFTSCVIHSESHRYHNFLLSFFQILRDTHYSIFSYGKELYKFSYPTQISLSFPVLIFFHLTDYRTDEQSCTPVFNMWWSHRLTEALCYVLFVIICFAVLPVLLLVLLEHPD